MLQAKNIAIPTAEPKQIVPTPMIKPQKPGKTELPKSPEPTPVATTHIQPTPRHVC